MTRINGRERTSGLYGFTLRNRRGVPVLLSEIGTIELTLKDHLGVVMNGRNAQNVKNANGGTYAATTGRFEWLIAALDMVIVGTAGYELHPGLIKVTWTDTDGAGEFQHPFEINVENIGLVP